MEFFKVIDTRASEQELRDKLSLRNLEKYCLSIFPLEEGTNISKIGGMWGEFILQRNEIMGGVRFSMLDCPNALAWTITTGYPPARDSLVVHLTINRTQKQVEFVEEINLFLDDIENGLKQFFG